MAGFQSGGYLSGAEYEMYSNNPFSKFGAVYLLKAAPSSSFAGQYLHPNPTICMLNTLPIVVTS